MKKFRFILPAIALLLALLTADPALAASKKKPSPTPSQAPTIASVTGNSITVMEAKVSKTLTITQFTEITVNGQRATAAELKPGMIVSVTLGTDPTRASRITATGK
jgi:hypothetical protein